MDCAAVTGYSEGESIKRIDAQFMFSYCSYHRIGGAGGNVPREWAELCCGSDQRSTPAHGTQSDSMLGERTGGTKRKTRTGWLGGQQIHINCETAKI